MKILIIGNMGYIGPVLVEHLRSTLPSAELYGFDSAFFAHCLSTRSFPEHRLRAQYLGDVRQLAPETLRSMDAVVYLAAVSNDPMGNRFGQVTHEINTHSAHRIAAMSKAAGVRSFVYASSCSMYGEAGSGARAEGDELRPLTAYANSKVAAEIALKDVAADGRMTVTALRFATACGMSPRLRLDLVLNDFVASALLTGTVTVLSDGSPWRPLIDVKDMSRALEWAVQREAADGGHFLAVNVGSEAWNFRVKDLAQAVAEAIPGTDVAINQAAPPDKRSYRVNFSLFERLAPKHQPRATLAETIHELAMGLRDVQFANTRFRDSELIRLKVLEHHISAQRLSEQLYWTPLNATAAA